MRIYKVYIHKKTPTLRNPQLAVVVFMGDDNESATWGRILKHRGIDQYSIAVRDMIPRERDNYEASWRLHYLKYETWKGLIEDEYRTTKDQVWCETICKSVPITMDLKELFQRIDQE